MDLERFLILLGIILIDPVMSWKGESNQLPVHSGDGVSRHRSLNDKDNEEKYRRSLKQSLSDQSLNSKSLNSKSLDRRSFGSTTAGKVGRTNLLNQTGKYKTIGASSRSLESASTGGTISSMKGSVPTENTIIVKGGRSRVSDVLNSEFAKAAGASFGAAGAKILAERIEDRFSGGSDPVPAQGYAYHAPYYYR